MESVNKQLIFVVEEQQYTIDYVQYSYGEGATSEEAIQMIEHPQVDGNTLQYIITYLFNNPDNYNLTNNIDSFGYMFYHSLVCQLLNRPAVAYTPSQIDYYSITRQVANCFIANDTIYFRMRRHKHRLYIAPTNDILEFYYMLSDNLFQTMFSDEYTLKFHNLKYIKV